MLLIVGTCGWGSCKCGTTFGQLTCTSPSSQFAFDFDQFSFEKVFSKVFMVPFNLDGDQSIFAFIVTTL